MSGCIVCGMWLVFLGEQKWDTLTPFRIGEGSIDMADVRRWVENYSGVNEVEKADSNVRIRKGSMWSVVSVRF